jgi:hypothetical protein
MTVYPAHPSAELAAFRREHRAWRVVPLLAILGLVVLGAVALSGCAMLQPVGQALIDAGAAVSEVPHPAFKATGLVVGALGLALRFFGAKYVPERAQGVARVVGTGVAALGISGAGVENASMLNGIEQPPAIVAPAEPGPGQ